MFYYIFNFLAQFKIYSVFRFLLFLFYAETVTFICWQFLFFQVIKTTSIFRAY